MEQGFAGSDLLGRGVALRDLVLRPDQRDEAAELGIVEAEGRHAAGRAVADDRADLGIAQRAQLGAVGERRRAVAADAAGAVAAGTGLFEFRGSSGEIGEGAACPAISTGARAAEGVESFAPIEADATSRAAANIAEGPKKRRNAVGPILLSARHHAGGGRVQQG